MKQNNFNTFYLFNNTLLTLNTCQKIFSGLDEMILFFSKVAMFCHITFNTAKHSEKQSKEKCILWQQNVIQILLAKVFYYKCGRTIL